MIIMICEMTNSMIRFISYVFDGQTDKCAIRDSHTVFGVIAWTIMFITTIVCLSWWVIPLRKVGFYALEFHCGKNE